jgi:hypothetical protein
VRQVCVGRASREAELGPQVGDVHFLARSSGTQLEQLGDLALSPDVGDLGYDPLDHPVYVVLEPRSSAGSSSFRGLGESADACQFHVVLLGKCRRHSDCSDTVEQPIHEVSRRPVDLGSREWPQLEDLDPSGQRFAHARSRQQSSRPRDDESAGAAIPIDLGLDGPHEPRDQLDLVDGQHPPRAVDEAVGIPTVRERKS